MHDSFSLAFSLAPLASLGENEDISDMGVATLAKMLQVNSVLVELK